MATAMEYHSLVLKGTRHGLLASIREDSDWAQILSDLSCLSAGGEGFLTDASITFDFGWREVTEEQFDQVIGALHAQSLTCNGILSTSLNTRTIAEERGYRAIIGRLGLAKHQGRRMRREKEEGVAVPTATTQDASLIRASAEAAAAVQSPTTEEGQVATPEVEVTPTEIAPADSEQAEATEAEPGEPSLEFEPSVEQASTPSQEGIHTPRFDDEEPTLYLRKTLRGGQKVVFAGNVVLLGDLNPGAQIEADGDIIVMGQLRGTVHAGAEGDESASVITSSLRATQLRIADRFWQGEKQSKFFKKSPLTGTLKASLDGDAVVVEALPVR